MSNATNDNDTWTPLGLAALRVLERCEQQKKDREWNAQYERDHKADAEQQREGIDQRLMNAMDKRWSSR